ncbi:MAG TPA: hypothetical protein VGF11_03635, partial [Acidimicrobiales bacterium]
MDKEARSTTEGADTGVRTGSDPSTGDRRLDPVLAALDPDHARPDDIMCTKGLHLRFGSKQILSDIDMS